MLTRYHLVEKNNHFMVLHRDTDKKITSIHKGIEAKGYKPALFTTYDSAMTYISLKNLEEFYEPEEILMSEFTCPTCGEPLIIHWMEPANRNSSGMVERVCSCSDDECALTWRTYHTENGEFVEIERFFCG